MAKYFSLRNVAARFTLATFVLSLLLPVGVAFAGAPVYTVTVDTKTVNDLTLTLDGTGIGDPYAGQFEHHNVQVVWGDGNTDDTSTIAFVENAGSFAGPWTNSHTYDSPGVYTITVRLYHGQPSGNDASADSVVEIQQEVLPETSLTVIKEVINDDEGTAVASDFTMTVSGTGVSEASFAGSATGTIVTLEAGDYSVDELAADGYEKTLGDGCSGTIQEGENLTCIITNDDIAVAPPEPVLATLTVIKNVINDDEGTAVPEDFTMLVSGTGVSQTSFAGSASGVTVTLEAGEFSVGEEYAEGYEASYEGDCSGLAEEGVDYFCTVTNDDIADNGGGGGPTEPVPATLVVQKVVVNDDGGDAVPEDFTMLVSGTGVSQTSFAGSATGVVVTLDAGAYSVDEEDAEGYEKTLGEGCSGVLGEGERAVCVITNDDIGEEIPEGEATLIVKKFVVNNDGGSSVPEDFTISVVGTNVSNPSFPGSQEGVTVTLSPGEYSVSEVPGEETYGYVSTPGNGCSGVIEDGETVVCYITNNDINYDTSSPFETELLVIKEVINDNGRNLEPSDFTMLVTGTEVSGTSFEGSSEGVVVDLLAGDYEISEEVDSRYEASYEGDCSGTIDAGQTFTCVITNDDKRKSGGGGPFPFPTSDPTGDDGDDGEVLGETATAEETPVEDDEGEVLGITSCSEYLSDFIVMGADNKQEDVYKLQLFLNKHMGESLELTGFYNQLTFDAVVRFQEAYAKEVLEPWDINEGTGLVYLTTKRWINMLNCPELDLAMPSPLVVYSQRAQ